MIDPRPDPDALLSNLEAQEARAARGKLTIFFGASAGVGKTFAMLSSAQRQRRAGRDVVVGVIETHGRSETAALLEGLERLAPKTTTYRDQSLQEFDVDRALERAPALILVDELAHSNVPGSRHGKRWQDVEDLLAAGIDVWTTVNVQHLETLNDAVGGIAGIRVRETVPDRVFDAADEIVLVDLPPDELLQRLREGKVYLPDQAERAVRNFFRKGNLIALRELALRRTADRVDRQMIQYRHDASVDPVWQTRESLLACIGPDEDGARIVRNAARIAAHLQVPWHVVHVQTPRLERRTPAGGPRAHAVLRQAEEAGAQTALLSGRDAVAAAIDYARRHNLARIVVGRGTGGRFPPWRKSFADRVATAAPEIEVVQIAQADPRTVRASEVDDTVHWMRQFAAPWRSFAASAALCAVATAVAFPMLDRFDLANIAMIHLVAIALSATRYGLGPAVAAAFLCVASFDFFFVPPRFSFAVSDVKYLPVFAVMLLVGLLIARLTAGLEFQARVARAREERMRALYEMSRDLSAALLTEQIVEIGQRFASTGFGARIALVLADDAGKVGPPVGHAEYAPPPLAVDLAICQWAYDHGSEAGRGTDTLAGSPLLYIPLRAPMRIRGVLALELPGGREEMAPEQRRLLDTFARLIAIALERIHYVDVARTTMVRMESEHLRSSLLAAISHDLRTPLTALVGLAEMFRLTRPAPTTEQAELASAMRTAALRMSAQVDNLLEMARLQAGAVELRRQWQPVEEVVGSAIASLGSALDGHRLSTNLPPDLPLLEFDAVLIERVLANLLENATKYTPAGSHIEIGAAASGEGEVDIWVEDDGPGIPPGKEAGIFEMFERGRAEGTIPGVGLGLALCRAIVDAHGGRIRAERSRYGGARFVLTLPRGSPPPALTDMAADLADPARADAGHTSPADPAPRAAGTATG